MIERNLGNIERVLRLIAGVCLAIWAVTQQGLNGVEWFVVVISTFLILNGVFGRCYLWYVLDINSCRASCAADACSLGQNSFPAAEPVPALAEENATVEDADRKLAGEALANALRA